MPKYVLAYHGGGGMPESEAEQAKLMETWGGWFGSLGENLVDGGNPTGASKTIASSGVTNGGGSSPITGYSLISAANLDEAVAQAQGCPVIAGGGTVEVAEAIEM